MSYTRRNFVDGSTPAIDADNLNAMDVAIKAHDDRLAALASVDGTSDANKPISTAAAAALALKADLVAGKIPVDQIPSIAMQTPFSAASESAMLALDAQTGDVCIRSDTKATYMLGAMPASVLANWLLMTVTADPLLPNQNQKNALAGTGSPSAGNPFVTNDTLTNGYGYFHDWNAAKSYGINEPCFYNGIPYKSLVVANKNNRPDLNPTLWQVTGGGSGTAGNDVYLSCTFESGTEGIVTYNDGTVAPVDGIGGTAVSTITRNTTNPLFGKADLIFNKDGNDRHGEGFSKDFPIDRGATSEPADLSFYYVTGSNYLDGYATVSIFDVTNNVFCPVSLPNLPATFGSIGKYIATFAPNANSTSYRIIVHVATATLTAWALEVDNFQLGNWKTFSAPVVTPWVDYTPTFTGFGTVTINKAQWKRDGEDLLLRIKFTSGTSTAVEAQMTLPNGFTSRANVPTLEVVGIADVNSMSVSQFFMLSEPSKNYIVFGQRAGSATGLTKQNGNSMLATGQIMSLDARIPCAQFSVNSTFIGVNEPFYLSNSETVANTNGVVAKTKLGIDGSPLLAHTAATYMDMALPRALLPNEVIILQFRSKANGAWVDGIYAGVDSFSLMSLMGSFISNPGGNYIRGCAVTQPSSGKVRVRFTSVIFTPIGSWESSIGGIDRTWASIIAAADGYDAWRVRIGQASTGAELAPNVRAEYQINSSTVLSAGVYNRILFNLKTEDTCSAVTTGTNWQFMAPTAGVYLIDSVVGGNSVSDVSAANLSVYKNGSMYGLISQNDLPSGYGWNQWGTLTLRLYAGDIIYMVGYYSTGSSITLSSGHVAITRISN